MDRARLATISRDAKTVKLADLIHNAVNIIRYDPDFAKVFMSEMDGLLNVLAEGDSTLLETALRIVNDYKERVINRL